MLLNYFVSVYLIRKEQLKSNSCDKNRNKNDDDDGGDDDDSDEKKINNNEMNIEKSSNIHIVWNNQFTFFSTLICPVCVCFFVFRSCFLRDCFCCFWIEFFRNEIFRWNLATYSRMRTTRYICYATTQVVINWILSITWGMLSLSCVYRSYHLLIRSHAGDNETINIDLLMHF